MCPFASAPPRAADGRQRTRRAVPLDRPDVVDLKSPDLYKNNRHVGVFRQIRRESPIYWNPEADSTGFWAITSHADVLAVIQDTDTFSPAIEHGGVRIFNIAEVSFGEPVPHIFSMRGAKHTQLRKTLAPIFAPAHVALLEMFIRERVRTLLRKFADRGHADFTREVASPLVASVLATLFDAPEEDSQKLITWAQVLTGDDDPEYDLAPSDRLARLDELDVYARALFASRRGKAGSDLASCLVAAVEDDENALALFVSNFAAFVLAGTETTRHSISNALWLFSTYPEQKRKLLADGTLLKPAVKEVLRWATPVLHIRRTATRDVALGGQRIRKGDKVVAWYTSANRDEAVWDDPDVFDIERFTKSGVGNSLAFGAGPHHCLGWRVAELQLGIALDETFAIFPDIEVVEPIDRLRSNLLLGVKRLPVRFSPPRSAD